MNSSVSSVSLWLTFPLYQFNIVPKRITEMEPLIIRDLWLLNDRPLVRLDPPPPIGQVGDLKRDMCPRFPLDPVFQTNMQLKIARMQPDSVRFENRRAVNRLESHEPNVKLPRSLQRRHRDVQLSMINTSHHIQPSSARGFLQDPLQILPILTLARLIDQQLKFARINEAPGEGDLFDTRHLQPLPLLERLHELRA